jgi:hypothetical protein
MHDTAHEITVRFVERTRVAGEYTITVLIGGIPRQLHYAGMDRGITVVAVTLAYTEAVAIGISFDCRHDTITVVVQAVT